MIVFVLKENESEKAKQKSIKKYEEINHVNLGGLSYTEFGKPQLENGYISVSHTEDVIIIAISSKNVGIDIESKERKIKLDNISIERWTEIESFFKWKGTGVVLSEIYNEFPMNYMSKLRCLEKFYISIYSEDNEIFVMDLQ